jgi:hypothetical protein
VAACLARAALAGRAVRAAAMVASEDFGAGARSGVRPCAPISCKAFTALAIPKCPRREAFDAGTGQGRFGDASVGP